MKFTNHFKRFFIVLVSLLIQVYTYAQQPAATNPQLTSQTQSILFVGNSYTHMNSMPVIFDKIAEAKGVKMHVEMNAFSNHSFKMHSLRPDLYAKLRERKWDYVILQGFSRELSYPQKHIDTASVPYIQQILDSVYASNSCTNVMLYMTWGYKDGFAERPEVDSYTKMSDSIRKGYEYISTKYNLPIVPVGQVWQDVRNNSKINLYREDGQHPTLEGSFLIAYTFFTAIFKNTPIGGYNKGILEKDASFLANTAYKYVNLHLEEFKLIGNVVKVKPVRTKTGEYLAHCTAFFPGAISLKWYFGDGKSSTDSIVTHKFKYAQEYIVTLVIEEECGVRKIKRKIKFEKPLAPSPYERKKPKLDVTKTKKS